MMDEQFLLHGAIWYGVFLFSVVLHEASHALVNYWGGDTASYSEGLVTVNPLPHMRREPVGMALMPLLSYASSGFILGWGSAPFSRLWAEEYPRRAALMSIAGPFANLLIFGTVFALARIGIQVGVFEAFPYGNLSAMTLIQAVNPGVWETLAKVLSMTFVLNLLLLVLNMLPLPPLDGFSALGLILPESVARALNTQFQNGTFAVIGILVAMRLLNSIFPEVFGFAAMMLYRW